MDLLGQTSLIVGVTSFALGLSVLARNVRNKLYLAFALLTALISGWALAFFLERLWADGTFYRLHLFFNIWLGPAAVALVLVMVRVWDVVSRRLLDLSVLLSLALSVSLALRLDSLPWVLQLIYFSPVVVIGQILRLMWIDGRLKRGGKRIPKTPTVGFERRHLIYLGGLLVLLTSVQDHVPWMGRVVPAIGNIALTIYLFFLSQAISQQRLLNFGALVSRFLVLIAVAFTLTIVYLLLVGWIQDSPGLFFLNSFIASFLLLMLLDPLRKLVGYFTQRLLSPKHRRLEEVLRDSQRDLTGIVDPGSLFQAILGFTQLTLEPSFASLFVLRSDGTKYRRVRTVGDEQPTPEETDGVAPKGPARPPVREVLADHPLLQHSASLQQKGRLPILLDQILESEIDRSASRAQRESLAAIVQGLRALSANLLVPIFDSGKILGFVICRVPAPPEPWGSNWGLLSVIYPYFEQAGATLRSMEVFVRSREKERLATLGEMAAGLAHEIRNPLGAIKGAAQLLDPSADRPDSKFLRVIIEETDRLNRVVSQFLDYSKPATTDFQPVDLAVLARKTVELIRPTVPEGVQLEFSASGAPRVLASSGQLQQVLLNLVQNSIRAGAPRIRVLVENESESSSREVVLAVEDNGPGIKREHLDKLFIPFFTTSPSGTGLGLSISQKIVEAHRGRIEVATEEGRFTRFSVILNPLKE